MAPPHFPSPNNYVCQLTYCPTAVFIIEDYHCAVLVSTTEFKNASIKLAFLLNSINLILSELCQPELDLFFRKHRLCNFLVCYLGFNIGFLCLNFFKPVPDCRRINSVLYFRKNVADVFINLCKLFFKKWNCPVLSVLKFNNPFPMLFIISGSSKIS